MNSAADCSIKPFPRPTIVGEHSTSMARRMMRVNSALKRKYNEIHGTTGGRPDPEWNVPVDSTDLSKAYLPSEFPSKRATEGLRNCSSSNGRGNGAVQNCSATLMVDLS
jgi:hypothetical protein